MPHLCVSLRAFLLSACLIPALSLVDTSAAFAAKIKMAFPGPVTTFSLPYLVAQKKGWMGGLEVEDVHVTGDANAMRVLLSGNADIALVGMLNVLASIHAGASIRAIHSWQPIGDYSLVLATGKGTTIADLAGKTFATSGPGALPDQLARLMMRKYGVDESTAKFVQGQLKANLGVDVTLDAVDANTLSSRLSTGDFQIAGPLGWMADYPDPSDWFGIFLTTSSNNFAFYQNKQYDNFVRVAGSDDKPDRRDQEYLQAQKMLVNDVPVAFLAQSVNWHLARPYVRGVTATPVDEWPGALFPAQIYIAAH